MTPNQLSKSGTEHGEQVAFFAYCAVAYRHGFNAADMWAANGVIPGKSKLMVDAGMIAVPALEWIHSSGNGATLGDNAKSRAIRAGKMKAAGMRNGVPDIFLPFPLGDERGNMFAGLYIEMKKPSEKPVKETSKGGMSDEQIKFRDYCRSVGYVFKTCYTWREAVETVKQYLGVYDGQRLIK